MKKLVIVSAPCGVGKSTIQEELESRKLLEDYACIDSDEVGINWWDYEGTEHEDKFNDDCLKKAVRMSGDKHLLFVGCLNPFDYYGKITIPEGIGATYFIGMVCSDEEIRRRLKARPAERMCGSDAFIESQIEYSAWYKKNKGKFQFFLDNTELEISKTAELIAEFTKKL